MKTAVRAIWFLAGSLFLFAIVATAQEGAISVGKLKLHPGVTVEGIFDDNIYLGNGTNDTTELEEGDWITHVKPTGTLVYTIPERGEMALGYEGDIAFYSDYNANDWDSHSAFARLNYEAPGGPIFGGDYRFTDTEDPYGSDNQYKVGVAQTERTLHDAKMKLGYNFSNRVRLLGFYNYNTQSYDRIEDWTQDYTAYEYGVGLEGKVLPKTWIFARYHTGEQDYDSHAVGGMVDENNDADYDWHRINAGFNWDSGAKLSGELNFGYQWQNHDNSLDPNNNLYEDKDTWIANTSVSFKPTQKTTWSITATRAVRSSGSNTNEYFNDTGIGIDLWQRFHTKFILTGGFFYSENNYNLPIPIKREQENWNTYGGIAYEIRKWLTCGFKYTYFKKDSNYFEDEYTVNKYMVSLGVRF